MSEHEERPQEGRAGYPEEGPPGVADGSQEPGEDQPPREGGQTGAGERAGGGDDDETATGNPHAADN
jgi:hypothetical protein